MNATSSGKAKVSLPSDLEIVITRQFEAPRALVFEACTRPEHVRRWWGLREHAMVVCEIDLRVGGAYRFVLRDPDGQDYGFNGVYREIIPPERVVNTFVFEPMPEHEALDTMMLEERDGITTMTTTTRHRTREARDGHLAAGMESGMQVTMDRLEELLATMI